MEPGFYLGEGSVIHIDRYYKGKQVLSSTGRASIVPYSPDGSKTAYFAVIEVPDTRDMVAHSRTFPVISIPDPLNGREVFYIESEITRENSAGREITYRLTPQKT